MSNNVQTALYGHAVSMQDDAEANRICDVLSAALSAPAVREAIQALAQMADAALHQSAADQRNILETLAERLTALCAPLPIAPKAEPRKGFALVPLRMNQAMQDVVDAEGWQWEDLLAAAEAITEEQYDAIATLQADSEQQRA